MQPGVQMPTPLLTGWMTPGKSLKLDCLLVYVGKNSKIYLRVIVRIK